MIHTTRTRPPTNTSLLLPQRRSQVEHIWREVVLRQTQTVTRGPVPLYTEAYGDSTSPYVILCTHGLWQSLDAWREQCAFLAQSGCYVVAWDLPYHGLSGPFGDHCLQVQPDFWAECLQAVIEEYDLSEVLLLAWSFGGLIVGDYLRCFGTEGIAGLVLVGSALLGQEGEWQWLNSLLDATPALAGLLSTDRQERQTVLPFLRLLTATPPSPADRYRILLAMHHAAWRLDGTILTQGRTASRSLPSLLHLPTLLIAGEHDSCFPPPVVQASRVYVPQAESLIYPCGHFPMLECPALLNTDVLRFLFQVHREHTTEALQATEERDLQ